MPDAKDRDPIDDMVDAIIGLMSREQSRGKVMDELSRPGKGELFILRYLLEKSGAVLPSEIAEALGSSTSRVSAALGALEKKGLVSRQIDHANRRNILVTITEAGRNRITQMTSNMRNYLRAVIIEMGMEDAREFMRLNKKFFEIAFRTMGEKKRCGDNAGDACPR